MEKRGPSSCLQRNCTIPSWVLKEGRTCPALHRICRMFSLPSRTPDSSLMTEQLRYWEDWWLILQGKQSCQKCFSIQFSSVQSLSRVRLFATPWITARQASLAITISWSSLKLISIKSVMPSSYLVLCHPLFLLPPIPPSIRVFSIESTLRMRWPKYWSFSLNIIPSKEHPGLISFRMDWLDLLAVQGTVKDLLQHHSSKASVLWHSAFFTVQLSHPYMTTWKTIALTRRTFVGKVMSLLFNMLSRLVITFLPRSKRLLKNFMAAVTICSDFGAHKNKVWHCFHWFPIYFPRNDGTNAMIFVFWMLSFRC